MNKLPKIFVLMTGNVLSREKQMEQTHSSVREPPKSGGSWYNLEEYTFFVRKMESTWK